MQRLFPGIVHHSSCFRCAILKNSTACWSLPIFYSPSIRQLSGSSSQNFSCGNKCSDKCGSCHKLYQCWNCHSFTDCTSRFCPLCHKIQPVYSIEDGGCNYFQLFGLPEVYDIDPEKLELSFKNLQKVIHPDLFSTKSEEEKHLSANVSTTLNIAHNRLKDPVSRAAYLVKLCTGKNVLGEDGNYKLPMDMLMEIMEIRERLGDAKTKEDKDKLRKETLTSYTSHENAFRCSLCKNDNEKLCDEAVAMKYYDSILREIDDRVK